MTDLLAQLKEALAAGDPLASQEVLDQLIADNDPAITHQAFAFLIAKAITHPNQG